jgi:hypothetical protein
MDKDTSEHIAAQRERVAVIETVLENMERKLAKARRLYAQECDYLEALVAMETEGVETGAK